MAKSIVLPVGTAPSPLVASHSSRVVASELVALLKSMFDDFNGSTRIYDSTFNMDDPRFQLLIKIHKEGIILQLPKIMVALDILAHKRYRFLCISGRLSIGGRGTTWNPKSTFNSMSTPNGPSMATG